MRTEIGGEFWEIPIYTSENDLFQYDVKWFLSGRFALKHIICEILQKNNVNSVAIPSWCCESMIIPFLEAGLEVKFYPVLGTRQDTSNINADILFVMDYFGYTGYSDASNFDGIVIRDVTHSMFSKRYADADYYFGSLRKWAGFFTGGVAWGIERGTEKCDKKFSELRKQAMSMKRSYIKGLIDTKEYLSLFQQAEGYLDELKDTATADYEDIQAARLIDVEYVRHRRRENASCLLDAFNDVAIFNHMENDDTPLFVPIRVPDGKRDALRKYLIQNEVYCPVHWPLTQYHKVDSETREIYDNEISLVCDQRYSVEDMRHMINVINHFWEETK